VTGFGPLRERFHQLIPAVDVEFGKNWEFNFGVSMGFTKNNERLMIKAILGYRFNFKGTS